MSLQALSPIWLSLSYFAGRWWVNNSFSVEEYPEKPAAVIATKGGSIDYWLMMLTTNLWHMKHFSIHFTNMHYFEMVYLNPNKIQYSLWYGTNRTKYGKLQRFGTALYIQGEKAPFKHPSSLYYSQLSVFVSWLLHDKLYLSSVLSWNHSIKKSSLVREDQNMMHNIRALRSANMCGRFQDSKQNLVLLLALKDNYMPTAFLLQLIQGQQISPCKQVSKSIAYFCLDHDTLLKFS